VDRYAERPVALRIKRDGRWVDLSYREVADQVQDLGLGLLELGIGPGDRVAILSENRPEWAIADYACLAACCTDVPIYPTLPAKQAEYILRDSGAVAVLVSTDAQLEKVLAVRDRVPALRHVIAFDGRGVGVLPYPELLARGRAARERYPEWRSRAMQASPDDLATLIYTRDDGRPQRGDAHPREHRLQRLHLGRAVLLPGQR
jgi:long-chain acyl-CoA synthetase